jgi:tetratricopeptide (TPR) repeat protein
VSASEASGRGGTAARKAARSGPSGPPRRSGPARPPAPGGKAAPAPSRGGSRKRGDAAVRRQLDPDALVALEEERDFLLRSLDDLEREHDAGDVDDHDYAELKDDYTARAAKVLRAIDDRRVLAGSTGPRRSWARTAGALAVVAVLAVGLGWFVFRDAGTRAPGQGLTGDARQDSANLVLQAQQFTGQATQALQDGDSQGAIDNYRKAIETYDKALEQSPTNVEAMTYRGWVLHTIALGASSDQSAQLDAQALEWLDRAVATDSTYADARVFRAILHRNAGDFPAAQADLAAVDDTQIPPFMQNMITSVRSDVAAGLAGATTTTTTP